MNPLQGPVSSLQQRSADPEERILICDHPFIFMEIAQFEKDLLAEVLGLPLGGVPPQIAVQRLVVGVEQEQHLLDMRGWA